MSTPTARQLFGGAITAQTAPDLLDASCVPFQNDVEDYFDS